MRFYDGGLYKDDFNLVACIMLELPYVVFDKLILASKQQILKLLERRQSLRCNLF